MLLTCLSHFTCARTFARRNFENAGPTHESGRDLYRSHGLLPFGNGPGSSLSLFGGRFANATGPENEHGKVFGQARCTDRHVFGIAGLLPRGFVDVK